jgi:hypothetical protein
MHQIQKRAAIVEVHAGPCLEPWSGAPLPATAKGLAKPRSPPA